MRLFKVIAYQNGDTYVWDVPTMGWVCYLSWDVTRTGGTPMPLGDARSIARRCARIDEYAPYMGRVGISLLPMAERV